MKRTSSRAKTISAADEPKKKRSHVTIKHEQPTITKFFKSEKLEQDPEQDLFTRQIELIQQMRTKGGVAADAPVDTQGCNHLATKVSPDEDLTDEERLEKLKTFRYQTLLSLLLSSQTKDITTGAAMRKLQEHGCTVDNILETPTEKIAALIKSVSFASKKAEYIAKTTKILKEKYHGDIPDNLQGLVQLPGIGNKMALLCMNSAYGKPVGIGVDTHVHRISNRLGWAETKTPEQTRKALEGTVPKKYWGTINELLVGFGQTICTAGRPKCEICLLSQEEGLCPYYETEIKGTKKEKTKKKKQVKKELE
jgi:endonuclease-3